MKDEVRKLNRHETLYDAISKNSREEDMMMKFASWWCCADRQGPAPLQPRGIPPAISTSPSPNHPPSAMPHNNSLHHPLPLYLLKQSHNPP
jgi:hypothetical protein